MGKVSKLDVHKPSASRTAIWVHPDPVYMEKKQCLVFEIPVELHNKVMSQLALPETIDEAEKEIFGYALLCIKKAADHPKLTGFEVRGIVPNSCEPHFSQEDAEEMVTRTIDGLDRKEITNAMRRGTVFWRIWVNVVERRRMVNRFREVPTDGFDSNEDLMSGVEPVPEVYEEKAS